MVYVLPVTDYGKERYIYLNYFQLQSEVSAVFNAVTVRCFLDAV